MKGRCIVVLIENDEISDGLWTPSVVESLREYALYSEKTKGSGDFPQSFISGNGNKVAVFASP